LVLLKNINIIYTFRASYYSYINYVFIKRSPKKLQFFLFILRGIDTTVPLLYQVLINIKPVINLGGGGVFLLFFLFFAFFVSRYRLFSVLPTSMFFLMMMMLCFNTLVLCQKIHSFFFVQTTTLVFVPTVRVLLQYFRGKQRKSQISFQKNAAKEKV
jgi:hypothetical protein